MTGNGPSWAVHSAYRQEYQLIALLDLNYPEKRASYILKHVILRSQLATPVKLQPDSQMTLRLIDQRFHG